MAIELNPRHTVYVGSFDPLTLGHLDIIRRGAALFQRLIVGIGVNPDKKPLFSIDERLELTRRAVRPRHRTGSTASWCARPAPESASPGSKAAIR